jgi:hypothetical protein
MQNINKILNQNIKRYDLDDRVKHYQICQVWEKIVTGFMPEARSKTMAVSFEKGVLTIVSLCKETAEKIRIFHDQIVKALNEFVGKKLVFKILCEC